MQFHAQAVPCGEFSVAVLDDWQWINELVVKGADVCADGFLPGDIGVRRGKVQAAVILFSTCGRWLNVPA